MLFPQPALDQEHWYFSHQLQRSWCPIFVCGHQGCQFSCLEEQSTMWSLKATLPLSRRTRLLRFAWRCKGTAPRIACALSEQPYLILNRAGAACYVLRAMVIRCRCYELTVKYRYYVLVQADYCMHNGNPCRPA